MKEYRFNDTFILLKAVQTSYFLPKMLTFFQNMPFNVVFCMFLFLRNTMTYFM